MFNNVEEALRIVQGLVPATEEQKAAAQAYLDSDEAKAQMAAKANPALSKAENKESEVPSWAANNTAVQAAQRAGEKAKNAIENPPEANEFGWNKNIQKMQENINSSSGGFASGDELQKQLTQQSTAAQNQAIKPAQDWKDANPDAQNEVEVAANEVADENLPNDKKSEIAQAAADVKSDPLTRKAYDASTMSIWDAYNNGLISKEAAGYFTIDAIAKLAKNLGRQIGNVGAQFTGGTIDNEEDQSMWDQRRGKIFNEETQIETEGLGGPAERQKASEVLDIAMKRLANNRAATINDLINEIKSMADSATSETEKQTYLALAAMFSGANMNGATLGATAATGLVQDIKGWLKGEKDK